MAKEGEHLSHDEAGDVCMVDKSFRSMSMAQLRSEMAGHGENGKLREYKRKRDCVDFLKSAGRAKFACRETEPNSCGLSDDLWALVAKNLEKKDIKALAALARLGKTCCQLRRVVHKSGLWAYMVTILVRGAVVVDDYRSAKKGRHRFSYDACEEVVRAIELMVPPRIFRAVISGKYMSVLPPDLMYHYHKFVCTFPLELKDIQRLVERSVSFKRLLDIYHSIDRLLNRGFPKFHCFRRIHGIQNLLREVLKRREAVDRKIWFEKVQLQLGINTPSELQGRHEFTDAAIWKLKVRHNERAWLGDLEVFMEQAVSPTKLPRPLSIEAIEGADSELDSVIAVTTMEVARNTELPSRRTQLRAELQDLTVARSKEVVRNTELPSLRAQLRAEVEDLLDLFIAVC